MRGRGRITVESVVTAAAPTAATATVPPLAGFAVGVTAARRAEELGTLLERRGALVQHGPALRIVPLADDTELLAATRKLLDQPPDITVATTGIGFRGWVQVGTEWGIGEDLLGALGTGKLIARGPKARGAIRASGLTDTWSPPSESSAEVLEYLLAKGVSGLRIAVQQHGEPLPDMVEALTVAGADVIEVPVYRWEPPADIRPLDRLTDAVLAGDLDVLAFTSAPAAAGLLARAAERGVREELLRKLRGPVLALCVGPVTAAPLEALDIPTAQPQRSRLGAMVRLLEAEMPARSRGLPVAGHWLELRGHAVLVDGVLRSVSRDGMALLRMLARRAGRVVYRRELAGALPGPMVDDAAVERAMTGLITALGEAKLIQTVVRNGYRLALDPAAGPVPVGGHCLNGDAR
jgi:uroporphyrinogen-III synthase